MKARRQALRVVVLASPALLAACGLVFDVDALGPRVASDLLDGATGGDSTLVAPDASPSTLDASVSDGRGPTGLDDGITLPDLDAAACDAPSWTINSCGFGNACRFATPDSGRCESCDPPRCTGNVGTRCEHTYDCAITYTCFRGICSPSCLLGQHECGPIEACLAFDYEAEEIGLCNPSTL